MERLGKEPCKMNKIQSYVLICGDQFLNRLVISSFIKETRDSVFAVPYLNHISEFFVTF